MPQGFDAASVAELLATLKARAEHGQFIFNVVMQSQFPFIEHPFVRTRPRGPAPWVLVQWAARYKNPDQTSPILGKLPWTPAGSKANVGAPIVVGQDVKAGVSRKFGLFDRKDLEHYGPLYEAAVCDPSDSLICQGLMLLWAQQCFDQHDQRMKQAARPPPRR